MYSENPAEAMMIKPIPATCRGHRVRGKREDIETCPASRFGLSGTGLTVPDKAIPRGLACSGRRGGEHRLRLIIFDDQENDNSGDGDTDEGLSITSYR